MTRDELLSQMETADAAWNAHDVGAIAALYTSDATVRDSADPDNPAVGSEAGRCFSQRGAIAEPRRRFRVSHRLVDEGVACRVDARVMAVRRKG